MNEVSSFVFLKKFRYVLIGKKKIDFDLSKYQIYFVVCKKMVIGDENSDLCLSHKNKIF